MQSIILEKVLNNTELGRGNTHESYVLITKTIEISDFMPINEEVEFKCKITGKYYKLHFDITSNNNEYRINGLGEYYRDNSMMPGDKIYFEKDVFDSKIYYSIYCKQYHNTVALQKNSKGFEILSFERKNLILNKDLTLDDGKKLNIIFKSSEKKRSNSPIETDFYSVFVEDEDVTNKIAKNNELVIVKCNDSATLLYNLVTCVVHIIGKKDV